MAGEKADRVVHVASDASTEASVVHRGDVSDPTPDEDYVGIARKSAAESIRSATRLRLMSILGMISLGMLLGVAIGFLAGFLVFDDAGSVAPPAAACDPATANLLDHRQWREEADPGSILVRNLTEKLSEGFWWGEYTFLKADGDAYTSDKWVYPYDHYWGFIRMKIVGNKLIQRNVFVYPPATVGMCTASNNTVAPGSAGTCGQNGGEKIFAADQTAVDCDGNLAGPYGSGMQLSDTFTTLTGDGTAILYQVKAPDYAAMGLANFAAHSGKLLQSQLTTLPGNGVRVRSAQGFDLFTQTTSYSSYYREFRLADARAWHTKLAEIRQQANVLPADTCKHDSSSNLIATPNCFTHFLLDDGDFTHNVTCLEMNGGADPDGRCA